MSKRVLLAVLVGLAVAVAAAALAMRLTPVGMWNDDAAYISQARQFVATGDLVDVLGHPRGLKFTYPPGYPVFLAPFIVAFPDNLQALRWVSVACMLGAAFLFGLASLRGHSTVSPKSAIVLGACLFFNPCTMVYGTSVMSETAFTLLLGAVYFWWERIQKHYWALGLLLAFLTAVRIPGLEVFVALALLLAWQRRWRPLVECAAGMGLGSLPFVTAYRAYFNHTAETGMYLSAWIHVAPARIGHDLLGVGGWPGGCIILVLTLVGLIVHARRHGPTLVTVLLPLYFLQYLIWPYFEARFFLPIWPLMLLCVAEAVPRVHPCVCLGVVLACGCWGSVRTLRQPPVSPDRFATYQWIRDHTRPTDLIEDLSGWRTRLLADRPWSVPGQDMQTMAQFLAEACHDHAAYVLVELESDIEQTIDGRPIGAVPPRLDAWLDESTLVEKVYGTPWDRLYRLKVDPDRFVQAFQHFYLGTHGHADELQACLQLVPDFPEARTALAILDPKQAIPLLESVVHQYPVDILSAKDLARAYQAAGRPDDAQKTLQDATRMEKAFGLTRSP